MLQPTAAENALDTEENYRTHCVANTETAIQMWYRSSEIKCNLGGKGECQGKGEFSTMNEFHGLE